MPQFTAAICEPRPGRREFVPAKSVEQKSWPCMRLGPVGQTTTMLANAMRGRQPNLGSLFQARNRRTHGAC
jgi:hypothetical protein